MMDDLSRRYLVVAGKPILSLAEFQSYAYGLPEGEAAPQLLTEWVGGRDVKPEELLRCLHGEGTAAAASSDESLEIVRLAIERLEAAFPELRG